MYNNIIKKHNYERFVEWGKLITVTGLSQMMVQGIGLVSGILVIRLLSSHEYALYTLANTMLGTMLVLADGGISSGVMSLGGKVWNNKEDLGAVLNTGLNLRKKFAFLSLIVASPVLYYLLQHHGASWLITILIILSLIPAFIMALSGSLLEIVPKLQQNVIPLQKIQISVNAARLVLLMLSLFIFPFAAIAVIASGLPQLWANMRLRKIAHAYADKKSAIDPTIKKNILAVVQRILPGSIYYCLSGQITIWLISIFGSTKAVAQVGALSRLSMVLSVFSAIFGTLIIPRFARLPANSKLLLRRFVLIQIMFILLSVFFITIVWLFPEQILWILGKTYSDLNSVLALSITGSCIGLITGSSFSLSTSRGWAINPVISISITILTIVLGILLIDISSLRGVMKFNIFVASVECIMYVAYCLIKISFLKNITASNSINS